MVPYIILKPEEEEEEEEAMASNLRAGFKERQRKRLSKSLSTASSPAKRTYTEDPHEVLVLNTLLTPMPPSDATGSSQTLIASSSSEKDVYLVQEKTSTSSAPGNDHNDKRCLD